MEMSLHQNKIIGRQLWGDPEGPTVALKSVLLEAVGSHTSKCRWPRNKRPWELYAKLPVSILITATRVGC